MEISVENIIKFLDSLFVPIIVGILSAGLTIYIKNKEINFHRFLVVDSCISVFYALKMIILSPEEPEGHKRDKKLSPSSVWGTTGGQN